MVTICTASLTFNNSTFCPHSVFMCFVWISEQTAIISLYNINWLVFYNRDSSLFTARYGLDLYNSHHCHSLSLSTPNTLKPLRLSVSAHQTSPRTPKMQAAHSFKTARQHGITTQKATTQTTPRTTFSPIGRPHTQHTQQTVLSPRSTQICLPLLIACIRMSW